jgi:hypothetical protein
MKTHIAHIFWAMLMAIALMFASDLVGDIYDSVSSAFQPPIEQKQLVIVPGSYPISFKNASNIAQDKAPSATVVSEPKLMIYQDTVAYEVTTDLGMIYVEANTGRVIANTTTNTEALRQGSAGL